MSLQRMVILFAVLVAVVRPAQAVLTIEITQGVEGATPIAIVPFGAEGVAPPTVDIAAIIAADLYRSGFFSPLEEKDMIARPSDAAHVNFRDWRMVNVDNLVIGKIRPASEGNYRIEFMLFDVVRGTRIAAMTVPAHRSRLRYAAHKIADIIFENLTGTKGAFATRIAYVTETRSSDKGPRYSLQVADADGYNPYPIFTVSYPLMSPAWSPDGTKLAYVTFEKRRAEIYVQDLNSGERTLLSSSLGHNGAPAWSPDGKRLAIVLSKDGNPEIYIKDLKGPGLRRITSNAAIDTEPFWTPDGQSLVFTSDRGGSPQLYRVSANGGEPERLTYEGKYNTRPVVSPDGKKIAMVQGQPGNRYHIAVLDLQTGLVQNLTDGFLDESPSFAPNGSMIIYATEARGRGVLAAVSVDGRVQQRISLTEGSAREPVWSPYNN